MADRSTSHATWVLLAAVGFALLSGCAQVASSEPEEALIGSIEGAYSIGSSSPEGALIFHQGDSIQGVPVTHFVAIELAPDTVVRYQDGSETAWRSLNIGGEGSESRPEFMESDQANTRVVFVRESTGFHARRIEYVDPSTEPSSAASWLNRDWIESLPGGVYRSQALLTGMSVPSSVEITFTPDGAAEWAPAPNQSYGLEFETLMSMESGAWAWHGLSIRASQALLSELLSADLLDSSDDVFDLTSGQLLQVDFTMNAGELELVGLKMLGGYDLGLSPGLLPQ